MRVTARSTAAGGRRRAGPVGSPGRLRGMSESDLTSVTLNDGNSIPTIGFGVFQIPPDQTETAVSTALRAGYRHIDTAAAYRNERETGRAIANSELAREDVFVVTKLWNSDQGYDTTMGAFDGSLARLGLDYLDLYLVHWPCPEFNTYVDTFKAFASLHDQGRIKSIGVSNFAPEHLSVLVDATGIVPAVNQVELHPFLPQAELRRTHAQLGVATEAWAPLGQGALLTNPTITEIADRLGKTPAQVLIRWHIQLGNIVIPKSVTPDRIVSNFDVFDFALTERDMASIATLDNGTRLGPDPRTFNFTGR
jgi:2,5-diketo-D-gluconate reductase A